MASAIHFVCRHEAGRYKNLDRMEGQTYRSYRWAIPPETAAALVGGWIYLHEAKADASGFGGVVQRVELADTPSEDGRYAIIFEARREGRGQPWRGSDHAMAWTSGPVEPSLPHERAT